MNTNNKYTLIACLNQNFAIGKDNKLLYSIKSDMANFKLLTTDNVVIMGRNTFESLPGKKPLKNRVNIIVTSQEDYSIPAEYDNTYIVHSLKDADELCSAFFSDKKLFIIGGGQLYQAAIDEGLDDRLILTMVNENDEGDVYFPNFSNCNDKFKLIFKTLVMRDHKNDIYYKYMIYEKINNEE